MAQNKNQFSRWEKDMWLEEGKNTENTHGMVFTV